jgi:hypothetical protein
MRSALFGKRLCRFGRAVWFFGVTTLASGNKPHRDIPPEIYPLTF